MADTNDKPTSNGNSTEVAGDGEEGFDYQKPYQEEITLFIISNNLISSIFYPQSDSTEYGSAPLFHRIKASFSQNAPLLPEASTNAAHQLLQWTRRGSPFRALLVLSVGTITLLVLTGVLVFLLFFITATVNAIVISLLMTLAAVGGFLALFFACVTAIYIGALSVSVFVISTATISAIVTVLIATGWIAFSWTLWLATRSSISLAKRSFNTTGSALSAYSCALHARRRDESNKL